MGITNFPYGVSSFGIPVVPAGIPATTGTVFFVCNRTNANGSDGNSGLTPTQPLATLQAAITKCTSGAGDVVVCMAGHAETVTATSIALNVAGVTVIGLGTGLGRPTFTFGAAAATITVSVANCSWVNTNLVANFLSVVTAFSLTTAKDFQLTDNTIYDTSAALDFLSIVTTNATANAADGLTVQRNYYWSLPTTDAAFISILGACDRLLVTDNYVDKAATNDAGHFITQAALVCRGARILRNQLNVVGATNAAVGIFMTGSSTTNTGMLALNYVTSLDTTTALLLTAALGYAVHENYVSGVVANSGTLFPVADNPA